MNYRVEREGDAQEREGDPCPSTWTGAGDGDTRTSFWRSMGLRGGGKTRCMVRGCRDAYMPIAGV